MEILLVTPSYFPIVGGSEVMTRNISSSLNQLGIHADIMTLNMDRKWHPVWKEDIVTDGQSKVFKEPAFNPFLGVPNPLFNILRTNVIPRPSYAARFEDYDIIHFIGEADLSLPLFSRHVKKPKLFQCAAMYRNGGIYKYYMSDRAFLGPIFKRFFSKLADVFVVSSDPERRLLVELGVPFHRISVLPIGVDTKTFQHDATKKSDNLVLFVGRIEKIKGLHILLEALPHVEVPVHLAIIGSRWNAEYANYLEQLANDINQKGFHKVMFLGSINQRDLARWYQQAAVVVSPFLYEPYSNVIRESLACGTPVISTGSHLVENGSDGILLVSKDSKAVADSLNKLLNNRDMRTKLGKDGRRTIEQSFSWESISRNLVTVYEKMLLN